MNSIKELKEQLGYEEIGLDDIFVFHCTQCGKCCIHREDILLSPKDLFHIAKKLKITPEVALAQYCETYLGRNSHIPVVRLKPQGSVKRCPLLKNQKCLVHDVKPAVCAMFPIGRYLALPSDGIFPENPEELSVGYVFNDPECGDRSETHTVREWFHKFNMLDNPLVLHNRKKSDTHKYILAHTYKNKDSFDKVPVTDTDPGFQTCSHPSYYAHR